MAQKALHEMRWRRGDRTKLINYMGTREKHEDGGHGGAAADLSGGTEQQRCEGKKNGYA